MIELTKAKCKSMKKIAVLGCTGSIGQNTLNTVRHLKEELCIEALAAHSNIDLLEKQIEEFRPAIACVFDKNQALLLEKRKPCCPIVTGEEGLEIIASYPSVHQTVVAITGTAALKPTIAAIKTCKAIALANKEILTSAGHYIMQLIQQYRVQLIPIDSEHSAIFQCLQGEDIAAVERIILTASGGPFLHSSTEQLKTISVDQTLKHPTWSMGSKITVDSSTLMNKGFEVIEAHYLFNIPLDKIQVVIHPQSIVHSLVEMRDGSLLAQMGEPSMLVPIQYALTYPKRLSSQLKPFDFTRHTKLEFLAPDIEKFSCLRLAYEAMQVGHTLPCYLNAANEVLVQRFLNREIAWYSIAEKLEKLMQRHQIRRDLSLDGILDTDKQARIEATHF